MKIMLLYPESQQVILPSWEKISRLACIIRLAFRLLRAKVKCLCLTPVLNSSRPFLFSSVIRFVPFLALLLSLAYQLGQILNWLVWLLFSILLRNLAVPMDSLLVVHYSLTVFYLRDSIMCLLWDIMHRYLPFGQSCRKE